MKKQDLIEKIKNVILQRITYQAPKIQNVVDCLLIKALDIDERYPVFVFEKPLNKLYFQAFMQAKKKIKFNLVLRSEPIVSERLIAKMQNTTIVLKGDIGEKLECVLRQLNVNYRSKTSYNIADTEEKLLVCNQKIKFDFIPFYNFKKVSFNGVICQIKQFILNGKNYLLELTNTHDNTNCIDIEYTMPLPLGYYQFLKRKNRVEIINLTSGEKSYFNHFANDLDFNFSMIEGVACSTFACVNFKYKIFLKSRGKRVVFFNFGEKMFPEFNPNEIQQLLDFSQRSMFELFSVQIASKNSSFDSKFNYLLPQKIWQAWNNFSIDIESENKWNEIKNQIVKNTHEGIEILDNFNLREVRLFHNQQWKRIFIMHGDSQYLFAGRVKYFNLKCISKDFFNKNNEIYLSFC